MTDKDSHEPNDQDWFHVKTKKGRRSQPVPKTTSAPPPPRSGPLRSVADITQEYHLLRADYPSSRTAQSLAAFLTSHIDTCAPVSKAICLGLGSFDPANAAWEAKHRAYTQLLAFEQVVRRLAGPDTTSSPPMECLFQEPLFTEPDAAFLRDQGYAVVASGACDAVDRHTFLYGIHLYRPLYVDALSRELPAMFVGTAWDTWDRLLTPSDDLEALKVMHQTYEKWSFPADGTTFSNTCLYWRKLDRIQDKESKELN